MGFLVCPLLLCLTPHIRVRLELKLLSLIQQSFHPAPQNSETNRGREYNNLYSLPLFISEFWGAGLNDYWISDNNFNSSLTLLCQSVPSHDLWQSLQDFKQYAVSTMIVGTAVPKIIAGKKFLGWLFQQLNKSCCNRCFNNFCRNILLEQLFQQRLREEKFLRQFCFNNFCRNILLEQLFPNMADGVWKWIQSQVIWGSDQLLLDKFFDPSTPSMRNIEHLQNPKWPPGGPKMADRVSTYIATLLQC